MNDGYYIPNTRPLTKFEEAYLIAQWQQKRCYCSRSKVIAANMKFVARTAGKYKKKYPYVKPVDLIGYGNLGFMHAMDTFDTTIGTNIRTWAVRWIVQSIQNNVMTNESSIRLPANIHEDLRKKSKNKHKNEFTEEDKVLIDNYKGTIRVEDKVGDSESTMTIGDKYAHLNHDTSSQPDSITEASISSKYLADLITSLPEDERQVIQSLFGINREVSTLRETGEEMGSMSHENVRKIRNRAYRRLKAHIDTSKMISIDDIK